MDRLIKKGFSLKIAILIAALVIIGLIVFTTMGTGPKPIQSAANGSRTFLEQFVISGGPIVWFVLLPLSVVTVSLAVEHCITIRRKILLPAGVGQNIAMNLRQYGHNQLRTKIANRKDFVSKASLAVLGQPARSISQLNIRDVIAESLQEQAFCLFRKIEWTNIIGNVAPMVGLFGTVFGMIKAFNSIVIAGGQPQPAQLAEGISIALVTTFWGLLVGIPALAINGIFRNRVEAIVSEAAMETETVASAMSQSFQFQQHRQDSNSSPEEFSVKSLS